MAMVAGHYSLSALAAELPPAARTWAKYLKDVEPSKVVGRTKYYRLEDAIKAVPPHLIGIVPADDDGEQLDLQHQSARAKKYQADKTKLEVQRMRGELHAEEDIRHIWGDMVTACRAALLALPSKLAVRVTGLGVRDAENEARDLVYEALEALAGDDGNDRKSGGPDSAAVQRDGDVCATAGPDS